MAISILSIKMNSKNEWDYTNLWRSTKLEVLKKSIYFPGDLYYTPTRSQLSIEWTTKRQTG
jgi:hypothetical protein